MGKTTTILASVGIASLGGVLVSVLGVFLAMYPVLPKAPYDHAATEASYMTDWRYLFFFVFHNLRPSKSILARFGYKAFPSHVLLTGSFNVPRVPEVKTKEKDPCLGASGGWWMATDLFCFFLLHEVSDYT